MENPIKMDDLGGTTIFGNTHIFPRQPTAKQSFGHPVNQPTIKLFGEAQSVDGLLIQEAAIPLLEP